MSDSRSTPHVAFARLLSERLAALNMTPAALGSAVGVVNVDPWFEGAGLPLGNNLLNVCDALGISRDELLAVISATRVAADGWDAASGAHLRTARWTARLSESELAVLAGVSTNSIVRWETGLTRPQPAKIRAVADALGVCDSVLVSWCEGYPPGDHRERSPFGQALFDWRTREGLSSKKAAVHFGVSHGSYQSWEVGRTVPSVRRRKQLRDELGLSAYKMNKLLPTRGTGHRIKREGASPFGELLLDAATRHGNSIPRLAKHIGTGSANLKDWIRGTSQPRPDTLPALAFKLRRTPGDLAELLGWTLVAEPTTFAELLTNAAATSGLTLREVAIRLGVHRNVLGRWVRGHAVAPDTRFPSISKVLNIPIADLESFASAWVPQTTPLGDAIRAARVAAGLSQMQVSKAIGMNPVQISEIERGVWAPSDARLAPFAALCGTTTDAIRLAAA